MRKTSLFEFDVPCYRKRTSGLATANKQTIVLSGETKNRRIMVGFAVWLGVTILLSGSLDLFAKGLPLGFTVPLLNVPGTLSLILYYVAVLTAAIYIGAIGLKELLIERQFSVEFLMAVAGLGALYLDYRFEAATVLFLYGLAEYFEGYIQDRAKRTVEKISKVIPENARVISEGAEKSVNVNEVETGSILLVKPGERIPLDGNVVDGFSHVDQALVTGESG